MAEVIIVKGNVKHSITLDPGVWIFDDRKRHLEEFFRPEEELNADLVYQQNIGRLWDESIKEGSIPTKESETSFLKKKDISGDWAVPLAPFLQSAAPEKDASEVRCHLENGERIDIDLQTAQSSILCFALDGKPIRQDGPVHLYFADGSNFKTPIKGITVFEIV